MASARDLKRRIRSVKGTQQITKAMKMVAAAKLRRAQGRIVEARPYADTLKGVVDRLAARTEHTHPLMVERDEQQVWLVVITSDKGLCGSFNANLLREAEKLARSDRWPEVEIIAMGRKAADYFKRRPFSVAHAETETMSNLAQTDGDRLATMVTKAVTTGQVDAVYVMYNRFASLIKQDITLERLLPVKADAETEAEIDYIYEPDAEALLASLLPRHVAVQVTRALYDSAAAEQAARMTAMDSATKNANEMIEKLTLLYNRSRQAAITTELIEIVSGAQALEG